MPLDPVCGHEVDLRHAHSMRIAGGWALYFCSAGCAQAFAADPTSFSSRAGQMRLAVGVMGSASNDQTEEQRRAAYHLGRAIASRGFNLITGACPGLPYEAARGAREARGLSMGISPALSLHEHLYRYHSPADVFDALIYTGSGLMGREVTNIHSSDMVVLVGGRSGTLGEFAIAYDEGKLIGVLQGTGGIADATDRIIETIEKDTGARLVRNRDPDELIDGLSEAFETSHFRRPSCFCDGVGVGTG